MKTEKKRTLKGSVLFTVVSVLALMIIFMTSALALASAANKRAHKSYSASQASYTARAAIDSILAAVGTDNEFADAVAGITNGGSINVEVGISDSSLGRISNAKISYDGTVNIFDPETKQWVEKNRLLITADVTLSGETQSIASHIIQDPVVKTDDGPGYLTMGGKAFNSNGGAVLGGAYINMGYGKDDLPWNDLSAFQYIRFKGPEKILLEDHKYWSNQTIDQALQNSFEAPVMINGNYNTGTNHSNPNGGNVDVGYYFTQKGKGITIWGDLNVSEKGMFFELSDNMKTVLNSGVRFNEIPFLYVDGKATFNSSNQIFGYQNELRSNTIYPFNIFAGSISMDKVTDKSSGASMYLMDSDAESNIDMMNGPSFNTWVKSVYSANGSEAYSESGSINSMGNVKLGSNQGWSRMIVGGDIRVEGNLTIEGKVEMKDGIVAVGGTLDFKNRDFSSTTKIVYAGNVTGEGVTVNSSNSLKPGYTQGDLNYVLARNVKYTAVGNSIEHSDYAWIFPEYLKVNPGTPVAGTNAIDFGDADVTGYYDPDTIFVGLPGGDNPDLNVTKVYKTNVYIKDGQEVPATEAVNNSSSWTYSGNGGNTITIKPISEFYNTYHQTIYPEYARREVLMGVSGPVKGTEGHISKDNAPTAVGSRTYNSASLVGDITQSCTITGSWDRSVTVKTTGVGNDIHVLVKDVQFTNNARINVDEKNGGKVYFYFEGENTCDYSNPNEDSQTKLVDSVYDLMSKWGIESNCQEPPAGEFADSIYSDTVKTGNGYTDSNDRIEVRGSTKFTNCSINNKTIDIYPHASETLWIGLDNVNIGADRNIVIHDMDGGAQKGGNVNFYITGNVTLNKVEILTDSFLNAYNSNKDYQVVSDVNNSSLYAGSVEDIPLLPAPRVNIYAPTKLDDPGLATLTIYNKAFFCAYVRAPRMKVSQNAIEDARNNFFQNHVYYDGVLIKKYGSQGLQSGGSEGNGKKPQRFLAVGCFNVEDYGGENDWTVVYIKQSGEGANVITSANGDHTYAAVDYIDY